MSNDGIAKDRLARSLENTIKIASNPDALTWNPAAVTINNPVAKKHGDDPHARAFIRENLSCEDGRLIEYQAVKVMGAGE